MAAARIMMQAQSGALRPLSFDAQGPGEPLLNSADTGWAGVPFELHQTMPTEEAWSVGPPQGEHHLRVILEGRSEVVLHTRNTEVLWRAVPGSTSFHAPAGPRAMRVVGTTQTFVASLPDGWMKRLIHEGAPPAQGIHGVATGDQTMRSLAIAMCEEVRRGAPTGALFAESLSMALLSYALDRVPMSKMRVSGALTEGQCRKLRRYVEERLNQDLRLSELAAVCGLRPRHFTTLFRRAFGVPPHRYVLQQRLAYGASLLASSGYEIAEIALRTGFSSQSHFTTAFRRAYGVTPRRYAAQQRPLVAIPGGAVRH